MMRVSDRITGGAGRLTRSASRGSSDRVGGRDGERFDERLDRAEREDERPEREEREVSENSLPPGWGFAQTPPLAKLDGGAQVKSPEQPQILTTGFSWTSAHEAIAPLAVSTQGSASNEATNAFKATDAKTPETPAPAIAAEAGGTSERPSG